MHSGGDLSRYSRTAQATILKRWETNVVFNGNPQIGLLLEVRPDGPDGPHGPGGEAAFRAEVMTVVTRAHLARLLPGTRIEVSFDPADTTRVAISALPGTG